MKSSVASFSIKLTGLGVAVLVVYGVLSVRERILFDARRDLAARRGIEWLLIHTDVVSPGAAAWLLGDVYNVVTDDTIKKRLAVVIQEKQSVLARQEVLTDTSSTKTLTEKELYPILQTLLSRACRGDDVTHETEAVIRLLGTLKPSDDLGFLYLLKALGVEDRDRYQELVAAMMTFIESQKDQISTEILPGLLSVVTHRLLYESDYLRRRLDPTKFALERTYLQRTLSVMSEDTKVVRNNTDLLSQALFSLQLLHQKPDAKMRRLYDILMGIQEQDGSWSQRDDNLEFTFHNTAMSVVALSEFSENIPTKDMRCPGY